MESTYLNTTSARGRGQYTIVYSSVYSGDCSAPNAAYFDTICSEPARFDDQQILFMDHTTAVLGNEADADHVFDIDLQTLGFLLVADDISFPSRWSPRCSSVSATARVTSPLIKCDRDSAVCVWFSAHSVNIDWTGCYGSCRGGCNNRSLAYRFIVPAVYDRVCDACSPP